jgi:hypothetical protein
MTSVPYAVARKVLRTGDLLATDSPGFIGSGIKAVTGGGVSHVCGVLVISGRRLVLETTLETGVRLTALSRWITQRADGPIYWWPARFSEEEQEAYQAALLDKVGARYESPKWMALRVALRRPVSANDRWFCSEIEADARALARPSEFDILWPDPSRVWPCHVTDAYGGLAASLRVIP